MERKQFIEMKFTMMNKHYLALFATHDEFSAVGGIK